MVFPSIIFTTFINIYKLDQSPIINFAPLSPEPTLTIDNFHLQSDFKLLDIYPYKEITRNKFNDWVKEQFHISFERILLNIADPELNKELMTKDNVTIGVNVASTSKSKPDYFYQWIRDGAITMNSIINYLVDDNFQNKTLQKTVENYLSNNYNLQRLDNWSGKFKDNLKNLGEPKFHVDSSPFNKVWGRPQNDGPALRVITIDNFVKNLESFNSELMSKDSNNELETVKDIYEKVLKLDLHYILSNWNLKTFDIWEEINSFHFFTSLTQLKALKIGLKYFNKFNDDDTTFGDSLTKVYMDLYHFINEESGFVNYNLNHIVETPSILNQRSGLDAAILIASLLTHDDFDDAIPFDVNDGLILNTLSELIKTMKYLYPINHSKINLNLGVALGRYPEDLYDGVKIDEGNPWFLTTLSASELLFKLIANLYYLKEPLLIDESNQHFYFHNILELNFLKTPSSNYPSGSNSNSIPTLELPYNSIAFNQTVANLFAYGDSFLDVIREHVSNEGSMSEQFNKYNGYMQGAENLTWSYGSFWNCYRWRERALTLIENQ